MQTFLGLIVAPALALACQSLMFSLVTPSCSVQTRIGIHAVALAILVIDAVLTVLAHRSWLQHRALAGGRDQRTEGPLETRRFLAASATAVAALSTLLVLLMWFAACVLSPCFA